MIQSILAGFALSLSLIMAIGAQNAFVLRQGLMQQHVFWVCLLCALSDAVLIAGGVWGVGALIQQYPALVNLMYYLGSAFLLLYGLKSLISAFRVQQGLQAGAQATQPLASTVLTCLALTWLNPHVYLDTVILLGTVANQFSVKPGFAAGAILASFVFFFSLGYGARLLRPLFAKARAWQVLDILIAIIMWILAAALMLSKP